MDSAVDFIEDYESSFLEKDEKPIIKVIIEQTIQLQTYSY